MGKYWTDKNLGESKAKLLGIIIDRNLHLGKNI